jgi:hypothetical protein
MSVMKNITITLDEELAQWVRIAAAKKIQAFHSY